MSSVIVQIIKSSPTTIDIYETDTHQDIERRISSLSLSLTPFMYLPKSFDVYAFLKDPLQFTFLDQSILFDLAHKDPSRLLPSFYIRYAKDVELYDYLEAWVFYEIFVKAGDPDNISLSLLSLTSIITPSFLQDFPVRLRDPTRNKIVNRMEFLKSLNTNWYQEKKLSWTLEDEKTRDSNIDAISIGQEFRSLDPLPASPLQEMGKILQLELRTTLLTTGILFEKLELNHTLCVAQYRSFYKVFADTKFSSESIKNERVPDFYGLYVYSATGNMTIFVQNRTYGLFVQCIFSKDTGITNVDDMLRFLKMEDVEIQKEQSVGLLAEFTVDNPPPTGIDPLHYAPLQAPIFANLCMNDARFSRFLSINDTDKISRQNMSSYVYFHSPMTTSDFKETDTPIYVGGWNRQRSRFGDLTAILTPEQFEKGDFKIHIKITRSVNAAIVDIFYTMISRLFFLYNQLLPKETQLFQTFLPVYKPNHTLPQIVTKTSTGLSDIEPELYPSLLYSRICQFPKPIPITQEEAQELPPERILKFPPAPLKGFRPRYYKCPKMHDGKESEYPFPGFIRFKRNVKHPFMVAPCCFKRNNLDKNEEISTALIKGDKDESKKEAPIAILFPPKNLYRIKSEKIIDQVGQLAVLPKKIDHLLSLVTSPRYEFSRIGMPLGWEKESILACLEFHFGVRHERNFFRSSQELRRLLLNENLEITLQQNYDIGLQEVVNILQDPSRYLDPRRFYRLLEKFYNVTLLILERDKDTIEVVRPFAYRSLHWYLRPSLPVVILYQHYGGSTEAVFNAGLPQCELVGYMDDTKLLSVDFRMNNRFELLFQLGFASFFGDDLNRPIAMSKLQSPLLSLLDAQWVDAVGKTRILFFTESRFPALVTHPMAPLSLPIVSLSSVWIPSLKQVMDLLEHTRLTPSRVQQYQDVLLLHITTGFMTPIVLMARVLGTLPIPLEIQRIDHVPVFLQQLLTPPASKFEQRIWNQRFSNILQDYMAILLSRFIQSSTLTKATHNDLVQLFIEEYIEFDASYTIPTANDVSPLVEKNRFLFSDDDRLRLPFCFQEKIPFFLEWFLTTKSFEFERLETIRELPSFYQYVSDFAPTQRHQIQTSLESIQPLTTYPYRSEPLLSISMLEERDVSYYFNVDETPIPKPYILIRTSTIPSASAMAKKYISTGEILFPDKTSPSSSSLVSHFFKTPETKWIKRGIHPKVAFFQRIQDVLVLLPMQSPSLFF